MKTTIYIFHLKGNNSVPINTFKFFVEASRFKAFFMISADWSGYTGGELCPLSESQ